MSQAKIIWRAPLAANFSHSRIDRFQEQSLIDNKNQLFFNQSDLFVAQAIRDTLWPAPGSEDTELGVLMELEVGHGETEVYAGVQA